MAKSKGIMVDRKSPDTALAQLATLVNEINGNLSGLDKRISGKQLTLSDFVDVVVFDIVAMAGAFNSPTFEQSYSSKLDEDVGELGYIKESELAEWLTAHGYEPTQEE